MPPRTVFDVAYAASRLLCGYFVVIIVQWLLIDNSISVDAFNLDTKIPIVKIGPETSHFGFTVAQHKSFIPGAPNSISQKYKPWMLVGAPKGENLQPGTHKSGALFKCPLTTYENDCEQVLTDGLKTPDGSILPPTKDEIKDDQWLGVTVKSQGEGGDILVCAHRYQHKGEGDQNFQWGYGLCYRLNDGFQFESTYQPCMGKPVDLGHEQFGYCQTGTSGIILEDEVVLGLPGTYNWRGTIHTMNTSDDYLYRDKTEYFGVYTDDDSPVDKYSYLGYSVAAGKFFGNKVSYVAGAPRSQGTGQVVFFSREKLGKSVMEFDLILNGEMFASSFGFEVLAMDTNGDRHDDLVVSAPFYFTKYSSGAVYIYQNDGNGISNETPFTRLEGPPGESRFGFSMTSLGDLNVDGYNDLAVGAPYDDRGAIYIYLGSKNGIMKEPAQEIRAEDLPGLSYDAFGYSLSGGLDLDGNNYTDLLTSSFCSDRVILLRARPIVSIETDVDNSKMNNLDPNKRGCPEDPFATVPCFSFKTCFTMTNEAGTLTNLEVRYNISERVYKDQPVHRIRFHRSKPDKPSTVEQLINLRPENIGKRQCFDEVVYLREDIRDVLRPVRFKLSYEINQQDPKPVTPGSRLPDINDYPILNQREAVRLFEATFAKDCGDDDICETSLVVRADLDLHRHPTEDHHVLELGKRQFFNLTTSVTNFGEPAYVPNLYVQHDKAIDLSLRESETGSYQCVPVENGVVTCKLDNPLLNSTGDIHLVFKPSGLPFKTRFIELVIWANTTSEEINWDDNTVSFSIEVKRRAEISITGAADPEQVFYSGDVIGESAMETLSDIGTEVIHKYLIDNRGPWKVDELQVKIDWPYQVENNRRKGKWLLYLTDIPVVDGDGECDVNPRFINPLGLDNGEVDVTGEIETDRLRGFTTHPTVSTTTKITKISSNKKVVSSSTKKIYKKSSTSKKTSTSEHYDGDELDYGNRNHQNRYSRKVFENKKKEEKVPGSEYDYNYDNKVSGKFETETDRLNAVEDIRTLTEDGRSFLSGYDSAGNLIWSSRDSGNGGSRSSHNFYGSSNRKKWNFHDDNNSRLDNLMKDIVDFRIVSDGNESWMNAYDSDGKIVWSSIAAAGISSSGGGRNSKKQYSHSETTKNGKGRRVWNASVTDEEGTRKSSGSSTISGADNLPGSRTRTYESTRTEFSSSRSATDGDGSGGRWSQSGGFRRKESEDRSSSFSSSNNSYQSDQPLDEEDFSRGDTYARAIVDPRSGHVDVMSQKIFSRRSGDRWEEVVHGPYQNGDWKPTHHTNKRTKRERDFVIKPQAITDTNTGKMVQVVSFTCDGDVPTAKCFSFVCTIRNLPAEQSASIRIPSRLWNSTLVEDYPRVSFVSIKSKGEIFLPEEIRLDQDPADDVDYAETLAYSNLLEQLPPEQVPVWVIIVSVLAGLLLLVLIAILLYKLGFFKRKRPDPTLSGNIDRDMNGYN